MDILIFNNYLKFQKEISEGIFLKILRLPIKAIALFILQITTSFGTLVFCAIPKLNKYVWYPLLLQCFICILLFNYSEKYSINSSCEKMNKYKDYCYKVFTWLKTIDIYNETEIINLRNRINSRVEDKQKCYIAIKEKREKWMQILIIPIILAIFSYIMKKETDIVMVISYSILIIIVFIIIFCIFCAFSNLYNLIEKRKIKQMQCFVEDLQGVLDTQYANCIFVDKN